MLIKTYEYYGSSPDGWNVSGTLELEGDERFGYSEGQTDYTNASLSGGAAGTWRREGNVILFRVEKVYTPVYFPWSPGGVLPAEERGDTLDFGNGFTLSLKTIPIKEIPVRNDSAKPKPLVLEPWGVRRTLAPGERVRIVTQKEFSYRRENVDYGEDEIVYRGWGETWATIVPEPPPHPPAPPPPPKPPAPPVKPPAPQAVEPEPAPVLKPPQVNPFPISPGLAARLRGWIDELPTTGLGDWVKRLCKQHDALPLHGTQFLMWALRTDGQVLVIDHESAAQRVEAETDDALAYAAVAQGAGRHPELAELLANNPAGLSRCLHCGGKGHVEAKPPAKGMSPCSWCNGMGWSNPAS